MVFRTFHQREPAEFFCHLLAVAIDDVTKLLIASNDVALIHPCANLFADASPLVANTPVLIYEESLVVCTVHDAERCSTMRKESHDKKLSCFSANLVDDIRILVRQVELIIAFLSCLCLDAQLAFIYIVEEQNST